jgi:hypothetical protein
MSDLVVTVPKRLWLDWIAEGDLPGEEAQYESHFWIYTNPPYIKPGERVYICAHGRLRGYAPLVRVEQICQLNPRMGCLVRAGGAEAVTIDEEIRGFQGVRKRWWDRSAERPFPDWQTAGVPAEPRQEALL